MLNLAIFDLTLYRFRKSKDLIFFVEDYLVHVLVSHKHPEENLEI